MRYKVLIADDNPLICESLRETINWKKYQCTFIQCAENGNEAWNLIGQLQPEIVITDIKMPEIDGLKLSEKIKMQYPDILIIMITGYQEFEYAKRAISLGVNELLLKPIDNKKMEEALLKLTEILSAKNKKDQYRKKLQEENAVFREKEKKNLRLSKNNIIKNILLSGNLHELDEQLLENGFSKNLNYGIVVGRPQSHDSRIVMEINGIINACFEQFFFQKNVNLLIREDIVSVIGIEKSWSSRNYRVHIKKILYHIQDYIKEKYSNSIKVKFCISSLTTDIKEIICNYEQTKECLNRAIFLGDTDSIIISQPVLRKSESKQIIKDMDAFYQLLETSDQENLYIEVERVINDILNISERDIFKIKCLLSETCISLYKYYEKKLPEINSAYSIDQILESINKIQGVEEGRKYLSEISSEIQTENNRNALKKNPTIIHAMEFIRNNYKENVTLGSLADYLNMNPSYLSRLLKKETGSNFVDILTQVRLEKAKQLLNEGIRVAEVGEKVGYAEYAYFYQVFKRFEGISPSEYKRGKKS